LVVARGPCLCLLQLSTLDRHKARTKTLDARVVLVARGLVDHAFAAKVGLERKDGNAIGLDAAVATPLAHGLVNEDPLVRVGKFAFLAATPFLGGAGLVIEENRNPFEVAQFALHAGYVITIIDSDEIG